MSVLATLNIKSNKGASRSEAIPLTDPLAVKAAESYAQATADAKDAEARQDVAKTTLVPLVRRAYFLSNAGKTTAIPRVEVGPIKCSFSAAWTARGGADLLPDDLRMESFSFSIDSAKLPVNTEWQTKFVQDLVAFMAAHGVPDALTAKGAVVPVPTFNEVRHVRLTPEQNEALEAAGLGTKLMFRVS